MMDVVVRIRCAVVIPKRFRLGCASDCQSVRARQGIFELFQQTPHRISRNEDLSGEIQILGRTSETALRELGSSRF